MKIGLDYFAATGLYSGLVDFKKKKTTECPWEGSFPRSLEKEVNAMAKRAAKKPAKKAAKKPAKKVAKKAAKKPAKKAAKKPAKKAAKKGRRR